MTYSRWTPTVKLLVAVVVVLATHEVWQQWRFTQLRHDMDFQQRHFDEQVGKLAAERLRGRREEVVKAIVWLHEYYASNDGLRRPDGLWRADQRQPDFEAIGAWIFDVYLNERVNGKTDEEARQRIRDAIRSSEEWRKVHHQS